MSGEATPFPLEGGRAGDGGGDPQVTVVTHGRGYAHPTGSATARARRLRQDGTVAERGLWAELRKLRLHIRRQVPIGTYTVDFAHHGSRIVFEVDGYHHSLEGRAERDDERDAWLNSQGYRVIHISEHDAREKTVEIAERIGSVISRTLAARGSPPPSPTLPPSKGEGR